MRRSIDGGCIGDDRNEVGIEIRSEEVDLRPVVGGLPNEGADFDAVIGIAIHVEHLDEPGNVRALEIERGVVRYQLVWRRERRTFRGSEGNLTDVEEDQCAGLAGVSSARVGNAGFGTGAERESRHVEILEDAGLHRRWRRRRGRIVWRSDARVPIAAATTTGSQNKGQTNNEYWIFI